MSILIKGMEMPKSCTVCPFENFGDCYGGKVKAIMDIDDYVSAGKRHPRCPLVPVPAHGDLIDRREAIIDANERAYDFWLSDVELNATIRFLNEQPTIIPAEEGET